MKRILIGFLGLVLVLALVPAAPLAVATQLGEGQDSVLGTWSLVVDKSSFGGLPAPKSEQRIYTAHPAGMQTTIIRVSAAGTHQTISFVSDYDNVEYPVVGSGAVDSIMWLPIERGPAEATVMHAGTVIATIRRVVSADGRTLTLTVTRPAGRGPEVRIYEREDD